MAFDFGELEVGGHKLPGWALPVGAGAALGLFVILHRGASPALPSQPIPVAGQDAGAGSSSSGMDLTALQTSLGDALSQLQNAQSDSSAALLAQEQQFAQQQQSAQQSFFAQLLAQLAHPVATEPNPTPPPPPPPPPGGGGGGGGGSVISWLTNLLPGGLPAWVPLSDLYNSHRVSVRPGRIGIGWDLANLPNITEDAGLSRGTHLALPVNYDPAQDNGYFGLAGTNGESGWHKFIRMLNDTMSGTPGANPEAAAIYTLGVLKLETNGGAGTGFDLSRVAAANVGETLPQYLARVGKITPQGTPA